MARRQCFLKKTLLKEEEILRKQVYLVIRLSLKILMNRIFSVLLRKGRDSCKTTVLLLRQMAIYSNNYCMKKTLTSNQR
jgi:hypothetical protein